MSKKKRRKTSTCPPERYKIVNGVEIDMRAADKGPEHIWASTQIAREDLVLQEVQTAVNGRRTMRGKRVDNVERLLRTGLIDQRMYDAGMAFKADFQKAQLGGYPEPKFEYSSPTTGERDQHLSVEKARRRVRGALDALGGIGTAASSAAWDFIGLEKSILVVSQNKSQKRAQLNGLLIGALAALAGYYFPLSKKIR